MTRRGTQVHGEPITRTPRLLALAVAAVSIGTTQSTFATSGTWNGTTDGAWNSTTNWSVASAPGAADTATFANAGNGNVTLTIDSSRTVRSITFNPTLSTLASYTIGSAGANGGSTLSLASTGTIQISNAAGVTGLTETFNAPLSLGGNYTVTNAQLGAGSNLVFAGNITNSATSLLTINGAGTGTGNLISGAISDGVGLQSVRFSHSAGRWEISGDSSYSGGTTLTAAGGTVLIGSNTAFGTGSVLFTSGAVEAVNGPRTLANNISEFNGGTIQGSQNLTFSGYTKVGASNTRTMNVTNAGVTAFNNVGLTSAAGAASLMINGSGAVNFTGVVSNGGGGTFDNSGNSSHLIYAGSNTLTMSGANTYSGVTTLVSGTVAVNSLANGGRTSFTITTTSGGSTATVSSAAGLVVGQTIFTVNQSGGSSSLQAGTTITSIDGTTIGLSLPATAVAATSTAFAGTPNGLGMSTNVATNLIFNGGTLKYTGAATSTDRLFILSGGGGTIDSSGGGLLSFTNTGAIGVNPANRSGTLNATTTVTTAGAVNTTDLAVGMTVSGTNIQGGTTISSIGGTNGFTLSQAALGSGSSTLSFTGGPARTLTLTGSSAGSLASILVDPAGTTVGLNKTGGGTWILEAANTFSGGTAVSNGSLLINNSTGSGTGTGAVAVSGAGARLGGSGTMAPGSSNGVTVGNGSSISPGGNAAGDTLDTLKLDGANTAGTLLTMNAGAKFALGLGTTGGTIAAPGQSDKLTVLNAQASDIVLNSTVIDLSTAALAGGGYFKLFDTDLASGTWTGLTLSDQVIVGGLTVGTVPSNTSATQLILGDGTFGDAGDIYVSVAIPEPGTGMLALGGLAGLFLRRRRK